MRPPRPLLTGGNQTRDRGDGAPAVFAVTVRDNNDGWDVRGPDGQPVGEPAGTQREGIDIATRLAHDAGGGDVVVHGLDGEPRGTRTIPASRPS